MNSYFALFPSIVSLAVIGCSGGGSDDPSDNEILSSWLAQTKVLSSGAETNCGQIAGQGASTDALDECIKDSFELYRPFYGTYERAGTDSILGSGIAYDGARLFFVGFSTTSCTPENYCYTIEECIEPRYNPVQGETWQIPFICNEYVPTEPVSEGSP